MSSTVDSNTLPPDPVPHAEVAPAKRRIAIPTLLLIVGVGLVLLVVGLL